MSVINTFKKFVHKMTKDGKSNYPVEASFEEINVMNNSASFSMASHARLWATVSATKYIVHNKIPGAFVECGVWRGGNTIAMAMSLVTLKVFDRDIYLFDTFEGMTKPTNIDRDIKGVFAGTMLQDTDKGDGNNIWCIANIEDVKRNIKASSYPYERFNLIKGDVSETLRHESNLPTNIALLRLDTDWYESTKLELEILFPRLVKGGVCLIDDYGHWEGSRKAVDEYFEKHRIFPLMHVTDYTGRAFIKL